MKETIKKSLVWWLVFSLTSLTVFLVYATGIFSLPSTATTGTPLSSAEWNKMVGSLDYLKWEVDTLKSKTLKTFVWATTATYNWAWVWWYAGWDAKCAAQFWAWARMCTSADFANWRPNINWFYNTYIYASDWTWLSDDCWWWTFASTQRIIFWGWVTPSTDPCSNVKKILCCQ